jgi:hypothetical protein
MDGDLGSYDVVDVRLRVADTIVFLDFSRLRCAWRAFRRLRERADFWHWLRTPGTQAGRERTRFAVQPAYSSGVSPGGTSSPLNAARGMPGLS